MIPAPLRALLALVFVYFVAASGVRAESITVAYAGSMGVVIDQVLGPAFVSGRKLNFRGIGEGSYALAHLLEAHQLRADVFISATRGPVEEVIEAGLSADGRAVPVSRTSMVVAYNPKSSFAQGLRDEPGSVSPAGDGRAPAWISMLEQPGFRLGRTDPAVDPMGRNAVFTLLLAEQYYGLNGAANRVMHGKIENPAQIFTETSLLSRLESGQLDAAICYRSAAVSRHLPYLELPSRINLGDPETFGDAYASVTLKTTNAEGAPVEAKPAPLVFYATVLKDASSTEVAAAFVEFLLTPEAQKTFARYGYGPAQP